MVWWMVVSMMLMFPIGTVGSFEEVESSKAFIHHLIPILNAKDPSSEFIHLVDTLVLVTKLEPLDPDLWAFGELIHSVTSHRYFIQWSHKVDHRTGSELNILVLDLREDAPNKIDCRQVVCVFHMEPKNVEQMTKGQLHFESRMYGVEVDNQTGQTWVDEFYAIPPYGTVVQNHVEIWAEFELARQCEFIWKRRSDLNGITLKVGAIPGPNYFETGEDVDRIRTLEKSLNFTASYVIPPDLAYGSIINGTWNGLVQLLLDKAIDFGSPLMTQTLERNTAVHFFTQTASGKVLLVKSPNKLTNFIYGMFRTDVWLCHFFTYLLILGTALIIVRSSTGGDDDSSWLSSTVIMIYGALFNQGTSNTKICHRISFRTLLLTALLYGVLTLQILSARLVSHLSTPVTVDDIQTIADVERFSYNLYLRYGEVSQSFFSNAPPGSPEEKIWSQQLLSDPRFQARSHESLVRDFFAEDKAVVLSYEAAILRIIQDNLKVGCGLKMIPNLYKNPAGFPFRPEFPYQKVFDYQMAKTRESGIFEQLQRKWSLGTKEVLCSNVDKDQDEDAKAVFPMVKEIFFRLLYYLSVVALVFVFELMWFFFGATFRSYLPSFRSNIENLEPMVI
ncbi:hypothetical protein TCAL_11076 [Tigriopus californicus]|uniref:Ionotropic glutamate receptor L-glutamate and glycine-binding domain-containing protein n=1 Tax=Tigriopus californicus TaxID=6832 RepID=A0A553N6U9_TIGCA|nr:hypothetical protein TCAL_11076 [Tigriopus californicus]|eukprot:TCALIF_11076-PA protein Name:"Similar to Grid1 Glutamate receptor ionotropic, delta-1 (Mus musculus)" AED:0.23 eAED:0.25 QI:0/0/0/0.5/1/1/2/0/616